MWCPKRQAPPFCPTQYILSPIYFLLLFHTIKLSTTSRSSFSHPYLAFVCCEKLQSIRENDTRSFQRIDGSRELFSFGCQLLRTNSEAENSHHIRVNLESELYSSLILLWLLAKNWPPSSSKHRPALFLVCVYFQVLFCFLFCCCSKKQQNFLVTVPNKRQHKRQHITSRFARWRFFCFFF